MTKMAGNRVAAAALPSRMGVFNEHLSFMGSIYAVVCLLLETFCDLLHLRALSLACSLAAFFLLPCTTLFGLKT